MLEQLLQYDTDLFLFLNNLGNEKWDGFWRLITEKYSSIPLYLVLLYLVYQRFKFKGTLIVLVCIALLIAASDQLANLFKYVLFQRPRPCRLEALQDQMRFVADTCGRYGYFSAHASSSMAVVVFMSLLLKDTYRSLPFILLFWAVLISYSRIYLGVHYPLDVVTGMFFGSVLGWIFYSLLQKISKKLIS